MQQMTQAYDVKVLAERMREAGGPEAEKMAKKNLQVIFAWLQESANISPNPYDNIGIPLAISTVTPLIMPALDQISAAE